MPYVGFVQHRQLMISPVAKFPRLTASEECNLILQDIFEYDKEGMDAVLESLCAEEGIPYDWETVGDEIDNLVIEHEDVIALMYNEYLNANYAA